MKPSQNGIVVSKEHQLVGERDEARGGAKQGVHKPHRVFVLGLGFVHHHHHQSGSFGLCFLLGRGLSCLWFVVWVYFSLSMWIHLSTVNPRQKGCVLPEEA